MYFEVWLAAGLGAVAIAASAVDIAPRQTAAPTTTAEKQEVTAMSSCHPHGSDM